MKNTSEKFYDRFTFLYPVIDLFLKAQKREFFRMINTYPSGRLLEIGVGNGDHFQYYSTHEIIGVDMSENMLARARKQLKDNIRLLRMNAGALAFPDEAFDYVTLSHVIAVVEDPEKVLEEARRVLKPGGKVFILNHFTPDNYLKYIDGAMETISRLFHFKSVFPMSSVRGLEKFKLLRAFGTDQFSYFKILVYEKSV